MPEQDDNTGKLYEPDIVLDVVFITNNQSAEVVKPGKKSLHFPTSFESTERPTILRFILRPAALSVWRDHLSAKPLEYLRVEPITVVSFVTDQLFRNIGDEALLQGLGDQLYFSRASTLCAYGDRKTVAVRNRHEFAALPTLCFPHAEPPFFAGTKVPSMKHSRRSNPPRSLRSWATAKSTCSSTFERTQFWKRRCTVWYGPYCSGRSCQRAPVRRIHNIPFRVLRRSLQGRPRPSARTGSGGRMVSMICHCWSVRSIRYKYTVYKKVQETNCHIF